MDILNSSITFLENIEYFDNRPNINYLISDNVKFSSERITEENLKYGGLHIYQMYRNGKQMINTISFLQYSFGYLNALTLNNINSPTHLGYHIHLPDNTVLVNFFTSHEYSTLNGVGSTKNIKLEKNLAYINNTMIFSAYDFVNHFAIINDPTILPNSLKNLPINELYNQAWEGFCTSKNKD
jgi:hypothetical protein